MGTWHDSQGEEPASASPPHRYRIGGYWGNAINWFDKARDVVGDSSKTWRVVGWKPRRPVKGDILLCEMQSGRVGRFVFESVEYCRDPNNMFFGVVRWDGYTTVSEAGKLVTRVRLCGQPITTTHGEGITCGLPTGHPGPCSPR